jgi:hypothetical protein
MAAEAVMAAIIDAVKSASSLHGVKSYTELFGGRRIGRES